MLSTSTVVRFRCVWSSWKKSENKYSLAGGWRACCLWKCVKNCRDKHFARNHFNLTVCVSFPCSFRKKLCKWVLEEKLVFEWHMYSCINMNLYISANLASRVHWQYLAILTPSFMRGRGENNQLKILQPPVCDKRLSLICSEADLLAFQQGQCQGLGLCSEPLGVLFPLSRREVCFYLRTEVVGCREHKEQSLLEKLCTGPSSDETWY